MSPKNAAAVALGRKGGKARAAKMTPAERSEAARKAVEARWEKTLDKLERRIARRSKPVKRKSARA